MSWQDECSDDTGARERVVVVAMVSAAIVLAALLLWDSVQGLYHTLQWGL